MKEEKISFLTYAGENEWNIQYSSDFIGRIKGFQKRIEHSEELRSQFVQFELHKNFC